MIESQGTERGLNQGSERMGQYRLLEPLGQGGMGAVHLAARRCAGRDLLVVLKLLRDHIARDEKYVNMFRREGAIAARLRHPNVVRTLEVGEDAGRHFLAMEFLDGQPFNVLVRLQPALPLTMRLSIVCEALEGLHYVHELRDSDGLPLHLIHRDVSPSNVFVTYEGNVKVLDFGVAKLGTTQETSAGEFRGRLGYAAPERLWGRPADRRSDVFAAGVMLWEAIACRPRTFRMAPAFFEARMNGQEQSVAEVVPDADPELVMICERALHVDPDQRYQTAELFGAALRAYLMQHGGVWERSAIGLLLQQRFADVRREMHDRIHKSLYTRAHSPGRMPAASPIALAAAERSAVRARPVYESAQPLLARVPDPTRSSRIMMRRPRRWPWLAVLCLAACVALASLLYLYSNQRVEDVALPHERAASALSWQTTSTLENAALSRKRTLADALHKADMHLVIERSASRHHDAESSLRRTP